MSSSPPPFPYRDRLALALDVDDLVEATDLASELAPWFGVAKIGLELFLASGPEAIAALRERDLDVFVDLKLHDIPTTVHKAARVLGAVGARYVTLHAQGGLAMLRAGVEGMLAGAEGAGLADPMALAVTVLTSDTEAPPHIVPNRVRTALEAGCGGLVCASADLVAAHECGPGLFRVVPGIRAQGGDRHDQPRAVTPVEAFTRGADMLVVGRAVTGATDPRAAARELLADLATPGGALAPA
ncbi:MAG: orotidine-5'-phosphate decarboxylase [Acidimicrobiia bacterium]|nr:orotidine-5'-phosphate decarboxylase [Acidimicrobiia bacterium]